MGEDAQLEEVLFRYLKYVSFLMIHNADDIVQLNWKNVHRCYEKLINQRVELPEKLTIFDYYGTWMHIQSLIESNEELKKKFNNTMLFVELVK